MSFWTNVALTFLVSMVPVLELRFAIPFGVTRGLGLKVSMAVSILGNLVPVPFIIVFIRRVFSWLRSKNESFNKMVSGLEARAESKRHIVVRYAFWGLVILVAIPLPGTGAWTGALVAALMNMRLKDALPAIFTGVCVAAAIVTGITLGVIHIA